MIITDPGNIFADPQKTILEHIRDPLFELHLLCEFINIL